MLGQGDGLAQPNIPKSRCAHLRGGEELQQPWVGDRMIGAKMQAELLCNLIVKRGKCKIQSERES